MKYPFEEFLKGKCFDENPTVLDDDMPDFFENWLVNLEGDDLIGYGNQFGNILLDINKK